MSHGLELGTILKSPGLDYSATCASFIKEMFARELMAKIEKKCKEVLDKTEWIAIATVGADGPHLAGTWGEYVKALGMINDDTLLVPIGGYQKTEDNLEMNSRIELLCGTRLVLGTHGPGKGCRIRGTGRIQKSGENFEAAKKLFPWARGVLVIRAEEVFEQL